MRARRTVILLATVLSVTCAVAAGAADDLRDEARRLIAGGLGADAAALRLIRQGAYPEDAAAALFEVAPEQRDVRRVAFAVVRASAAADPADAVPLAADVAGLAQPAPVPVAAAIALAAPNQAADAARVVAEAAPQAAPLIASAMIRLAPQTAAVVAAAAARAVPSQAVFTTAAALHTAPQEAREPIIAAVARATGLAPASLREPDYVTDEVGGNAMREAEEVLADLPLGDAAR
jgi:ribonuclease E